MIELGIHDKLPATDYHAEPGLSKSRLVRFSQSPRHMITPETITPQKQRNIDIGSATHTVILEPDLEEETIMAMPEGTTKTHKLGKELAKEAAETERLLLSFDEYARIRGMKLAVWEHPIARQLIEGARCERSAFWEHPEYRIRCKARWDIHKEGKSSRILADVKTTTDARPGAVQRVYANMKYHWQGEHYLSGAMECLGPKDREVFVFVFVERDPPHGVWVYTMSNEDRLVAQEEMEPLMADYTDCLETDTWPCYPQIHDVISLPRWATNKVFD